MRGFFFGGGPAADSADSTFSDYFQSSREATKASEGARERER